MEMAPAFLLSFVFSLTKACPSRLPLPGWSHEPSERPSFDEIRRRLDTMFDEAGSAAAATEKQMTLDKGATLSELMVVDEHAARVAAEMKKSGGGGAAAASRIMELTKRIFQLSHRIVSSASEGGAVGKEIKELLAMGSDLVRSARCARCGRG